MKGNGNGMKIKPTFVHYVMMGFGFATGAAAASIFVTLATLGVKELHQMIFAGDTQVLPPYQPWQNQTQYVQPNQSNQTTSVTGG